MAARREDVQELRDQLGADYTESVICQTLKNYNYDKEKVLEFFRASIGGDQVNATFQQCVNFLRESMPIYGAPASLYEDCVRKANNDISVAMDLLSEARDKMRIEPPKPKPQPKGPTAPTVVVPTVPSPAKPAPNPAQKPLPVPAKPLPSNTENKAKPLPVPDKPLPSGEKAKPLPSPAKPLPAPTKPLPEASEPKKAEPEPEPVKEAEPVPDEPKAADVVPENKYLERMKYLPGYGLHLRGAEGQKHLQELRDKQKQFRARIEDKNTPKEEIAELEDSLHRCEMEESCLQSIMEEKAIPDYMVGRVPTDKCVITVTVTEMLVKFTWKIPESVEVSAKDWIGFYIHDRQYSNKYESYVSLGGKREGESSFTAPSNGYYDLRYYQNNGWVEMSRSEPFLVGPKMNVEATLQGRKVAVKWSGAEQQNGDWVALYPVSTYSNTKYLQQLPVKSADSDGVLLFDAPRQPGEYEVRYFFTDKRRGTGYAFSGYSEHIVIPNEDHMEVIATHPVVKVRWQTSSQEPNSSDWVGLYDSSAENAKRLGWQYLSKKGLEDGGDRGVAEIEVKELMALAEEATLPEGSDKWEVRLFNKAPNQPFLRAPYMKPK